MPGLQEGLTIGNSPSNAPVFRLMARFFFFLVGGIRKKILGQEKVCGDDICYPQ